MPNTPSPEQSMVTARAAAMLYEDSTKKLSQVSSTQETPACSSLSKLHMYKYFNGNLGTYRVVARKASNHDVVLNCSITRNVKYHQATSTFYQCKSTSRCTASTSWAMRRGLFRICNAQSSRAPHFVAPLDSREQEQQQTAERNWHRRAAGAHPFHKRLATPATFQVAKSPTHCSGLKP